MVEVISRIICQNESREVIDRLGIYSCPCYSVRALIQSDQLVKSERKSERKVEFSCFGQRIAEFHFILRKYDRTSRVQLNGNWLILR